MLERLGLIGVSWRQGGSEALAEFALAPETAAERLRELAGRLGLPELAYLATCNRVELFFARGAETPGLGRWLIAARPCRTMARFSSIRGITSEPVPSAATDVVDY